MTNKIKRVSPVFQSGAYKPEYDEVCQKIMRGDHRKKRDRAEERPLMEDKVTISNRGRRAFERLSKI